MHTPVQTGGKTLRGLSLPHIQICFKSLKTSRQKGIATQILSQVRLSFRGASLSYFHLVEIDL